MELPKYLLLDVDGTIWKRRKIIPGVIEAISAIKKMGIQVKIITNNSALIRREFAAMLVNLGINDIKEADVVSSGYGCALMMKQHNVKKAFVCGFTGLKEEIKLQGITVYDTSSATKYPVVDAITVCHPKDFNVQTLSRIATIWRKSPNCLLFGANPDMTNIVQGKTILGSGAIVAASERMLNTKAINVGKPSNELMDILLTQYKCRPSEMMIVGDRIPTDIAFGSQHALQTVFVLTGVDRQTDLDKLPNSLKPDFVLPSLANLPALFAKQFKVPIMKPPKIRTPKTRAKTKKTTKIPAIQIQQKTLPKPKPRDTFHALVGTKRKQIASTTKK